MNSKLQELNLKYMTLLNSIPFVEEDLDYSVLEEHRPYLEQLDRLGNSAISVFDMYRKTHVYISPSYKIRLGLPEHVQEGPQGFEQLMHPDDLPVLVEAGFHFMRLAMAMENSKRYDYKLVNEFRIRRSDQTWIRMTEQHRLLETDIHGNIWLGLSIVDVSANQSPRKPAQCRLVHQETGEVQNFPQKTRNTLPELSIRELQILKMISSGLTSKQIAGELHISLHTVNTHRQNIIEKMNVANTAEAVVIAAKLNLLN